MGLVRDDTQQRQQDDEVDRLREQHRQVDADICDAEYYHYKLSQLATSAARSRPSDRSNATLT
jgi:hypothetical protein